MPCGRENRTNRLSVVRIWSRGKLHPISTPNQRPSPPASRFSPDALTRRQGAELSCCCHPERMTRNVACRLCHVWKSKPRHFRMHTPYVGSDVGDSCPITVGDVSKRCGSKVETLIKMNMSFQRRSGDWGPGHRTSAIHVDAKMHDNGFGSGEGGEWKSILGVQRSCS